ncbi:MAG: hypothetical protein LBB42_00610 [Coriobacteriales bacterium]|jgi:cytochrome c-type protein NapB|nr:hypothetical protein [Coriobacteriales bacterium]
MKKVIIALLIIAIAVVLCALAYFMFLAAPAQTGMPPLAPADHAQRFETGGADFCYTCHGNGDAGNPQDKDSKALPENHYVDGSYDSKVLDPGRMMCNTCHAVTPGGEAAE